ncbi:tRNA uridine-5-carboxymethylaminomethyl(34) synthesis GTPase MnmE [Rhizorhapis suberifaciens]|uniref:tRNA modification GTPase MnmE n=1 Tax=Rhizorhapis suberifaciens TaxID=13656 RepID=A0A840HTH0_9SPHN|nr:tRNA uridine-5-carboxymethylaminomethyl(34) synthesis GTPase MnmE [Rhizorhapis suberifaciens]MBB4640794.1 tRNA modification GTPase [Rhizorhapis suberifaciens]
MTARATIFALSSGLPPAAIAVVRISGPMTATAITAVSGKLPPPRHASLRKLRDPKSGVDLDQALVLWFPGPASATGEDLAELHLHGGRAVVHAVLATLAQCDGLREAQPGEYTRRAFESGRIDLNEAEGLADLLFAETETQRRSAIAMAEGHFSRRVALWQTELLRISALVEAELDFSDEDDVPVGAVERVSAMLTALRDLLEVELARPQAERLKDGVRVVLAGPPNAGKSTLLNALVGREAAIVSPIAGTTRDRIEVPVSIAGVPFVFTDTAGLRGEGTDEIEGIGIGLARRAMDEADVVLWLGRPGDCPDNARVIRLSPKCDLGGGEDEGIRVSAVSGLGMEELRFLLIERARTLLPRDGEYALNKRQRDALRKVYDEVCGAAGSGDYLILAEHLRAARLALDAVTGRAGTEDMLDALFGSFCIGK